MTFAAAPSGRAGRTWSSIFLLVAALLVACLGAAPAVAARGRHADHHHGRATRSGALVRANRRVRAADHALVANARAMARCHSTHKSCRRRQQALQKAGVHLAADERNLTGVASSPGAAASQYRSSLHAPVVSVRGYSLSWNSTPWVRSYVLERAVPGQPVQDSLVYSTGVTPPPVPGQTVTYRIRTGAWGSSWSAPVSISYPAPGGSPLPPAQASDPQAAPALSVSGEALRWPAVAGLQTYVLDTKVPGQADSYSEVSGTSYSPAAVPGKTVRYSLRTAVDGSSWSTEVSISFPASPAPAPEPPAVESSGSVGAAGETIVGIDTGGWAGQLISELLSSGIGEFRVQQSAAVAVASQAPGHVASVTFGEEGSISSINPTTYAAEVLAVATQAHPRTVEILNEPGGSWFWKDAETAASYAAYAKLTRAVHEALQTLPAASRPAEICSWDGGRDGSNTFGRAIKAQGALAYCDGITVHPYGGSSGQDGGAGGNRAEVATAHSESGLPVYITEVGWPTALGQSSTGDSQQWSEAQQAENMSNFVSWAKSTGYVKMVVFFNAVDYGTNDAYGIETAARNHKQSYATLAALSA